MKLQLDDAGHVVVQDGKPVYQDDAGKAIPFDAAHTIATITRLNAEAKGHRTRAEEIEAKFKAFEGLDADAARKAIEIASKLNDKQLFDSGKVDEIKAEAERAWAEKLKANDEKYKPVVKERDALKQALDREIVGGSFSRSKFIAEKMAVPLPMVEATFGRHFAVDGDKLTAKDAAGNQLYSRARPGEVATFDEALEILVDASPFRDSILKGTGASGSGATGSGAKGGSKALPRAAFEALSPVERMTHIKAGGTVTE